MSTSSLPAGHRVVVHQLAEDPVEALERYVTLEPQAPPDPAGLGPRDVVVAVRSAAVSWVDLLMTSGQYQHVPTPPYTPGLEYAGVAVHVGPAVPPEKLAVGDAVLVDGLQAGPRSLGAYRAWGGFASYAVAPVEALLRLPSGLTFDQGCNLLGNYETAYHCLIACGRLQAGETVLIHGASGATGLAAVQVAKLLGATVIATGRSDDKLAVVRSLGADHTINLSNPDGTPGVRPFRDEVKALTGGRGADVVYDSVGGDISLESLRAVRFGARFLVVGWASTPNVARGRGQRGAPNANQLPTNLIMMKGLTVQGCPTVLATLADPTIRAPRLEWIQRHVQSGAIRPHVSHTFPLAQFKDALQARWGGDVVGGCVLHP